MSCWKIGQFTNYTNIFLQTFLSKKCILNLVSWIYKMTGVYLKKIQKKLQKMKQYKEIVHKNEQNNG